VSLPEEFSNLPCPECHHVSCRLCKKAPHELRTCKEAEEAEKKKLSVRALAEEAMTAATVRNCPGPGCGKAFFKVEGCNKMKCPSCKTLSCYLCRQEISDYKHFCQTFNCQHNSCGKCILFTNAEQDDRRARRKAGLKALANAGTTAADVGLLVSPPRKKTAKTHRPLEPARILAGNRRAPEPVAIPVANRRAPEHPVANRRAPEQQRVLEAQLQRDLEAYLQRDLEDHGPADAAHAPAPDNRRAPEPAAIPVVNRRAPAGDDGRLPPAPGGLECTIL
jgi:pyruvate/2-oxoglutarate dehydrogenase complex dihydrolipoamide acyltransferase (E2) component